MYFYAQNGGARPIRLPDSTRRFAYESLGKKYGLDTAKTDSVSLDGFKDFQKLSAIERYDLAITEIAKRAPIRICEGERLSGAATLGRAMKHGIPATFSGNGVFPSVSHLTVDFETVLKIGIGGIEALAREKLSEYRGTDKEAFSRSAVACLEAMRTWHARYLDALSGMPEYRENYEALLHVPFEPARSFYEAVASVWFTFAFIRLCGNWPGIGRIDYLLGDYLKRDLDDGKITLDEARDVLAHLFIKGCEWIDGSGPLGGSGDAQHYQNILLAGIDENGREVENEVTYLVLDILEELGISDFPTTVRLNSNTSERLLLRVAEVMRYGGGTLAVYNEEKVIETLIKNGYEEREARKFANDGCWEIQIPGKTYFSYHPFDGLQILQHQTLGSYDGTKNYSCFEELYQAYASDLKAKVDEIIDSRLKLFEQSGEGEWKWKPQIPCTVVSLFERGCIEKGRSYFEGGPIYNMVSPHIGGFADIVNSLYAIKKLVYDEGRVSFGELIEILRNDWEGCEALRLYARNKLSYYGNDNEEVDEIATRLLSDFGDSCLSHSGRCGYFFPGGVSTFGRQLEWAPKRLATPCGNRKGDILAANCSPTPSTDKEGATAIIRSYCKIDFTKLATGAALDIKLLPSSVSGEDGISALVSLMRGFVSLGGFFMQPDIVDASLLREAQERPENYQTLSVRVSGWNARFVTLDKGWQDMVIEQNEHR